jgi:glyoxylase-like metal-dependent hydrolase (beta-lactamase superfamily II)
VNERDHRPQCSSAAQSTLDLPVADGPWFRTRAVDSSIDQIDEPHVHELLRANIWHVRGRDRDLIVDTGLGVASLRAQLPRLFERDPIVLLTHAHLDHMGGAYEFDQCWAHAGEPFRSPPPGSLYLQPLVDELGIRAEDFNLSRPVLINAIPHPEFNLDDYRLRPAPDIRWLREGSRVDLGDREFTILHLPGHTPASIALFDEAAGVLFSGDVVYDDTLIDNCVGSHVADYRNTMKRLAFELDVTVVHPGHGDSFDRSRLYKIATAYLHATETHSGDKARGPRSVPDL